MHLFSAHRDQVKRYFANFDLPTHPVCWLRGHRARAEVIEPGYNIDPWILVACRTCGIRHQDPYMSSSIRPGSRDEAKAIIARQVKAARTNPAGYASVRDGRDGYGHHRLELSLEVARRGYRKTGVHLRIGDRWSETPFDGSIHIGRSWAAYFSIGGVGNRLAHWLTKGKKRELSIGAAYRGESSVYEERRAARRTTDTKEA